MWVFIVWGTIAAVLMAGALAQGLGLLPGPSGDGFILFWIFGIAGLPAWLVTAALTATRWHKTPGLVLALQNLPGIAAAAMWFGNGAAR